MMENFETLSRRSFFALLGGGVATAVLPTFALADPATIIPVEFGWTWYVDKNNIPTRLAKLVPKTLSENVQAIYDHTFKEKELLAKLKEHGHDEVVRFKMHYITEAEQNARMKERLQTKHVEREQRRLAAAIKHRDYSAEDIKYLEDKSRAALANAPLYQHEHCRYEPDDSITYYQDELLKKPLYNVKWVLNQHASGFVREIKWL